MEQLFCQSCGMPLEKESDHGTNNDGSRSDEYCSFCYAGGAFTSELTMDQMIQNCIKFLNEFNKDSEIKYSEEEALASMKKHFPSLKRWSKA